MFRARKIIRDVIHGYVSLTDKEVELVDSPVFQRLRKIKQLAFTHLVYPGAVHTRFEHSLGTLEMASRIMQRIESIYDSRDTLRRARYAALLHDLGHGPYSHVFEGLVERVTSQKFDHEMVTTDLVKNDDDISGILGSDLDGVIDLLEGKKKSVEHCIISGPLDADKLDYIQRDSYHAGVAYGLFDSTRLLYTLKEIREKFLKIEQSYLGVDIKGKEAVFGMLLAYYYMHETVYSHKTRRIADAMLTRAFELAARSSEESITKMFSYSKGDLGFLSTFKELNDGKLFNVLLGCKDEKARKIAGALRDRRLFKPLLGRDLSRFRHSIRMHLMDLKRGEAMKLENEIGEHAKIDPDFVVVDRQSISNPLYREPYGVPAWEGEIYLQDRGEKPLELGSIPNPLSRTSMRRVERFWVFAPVGKQERGGKQKKVEEFVDSL